ncbi:hypothetical protein EJ08DRAFT_108492 [Tothia fuscella]|uniref:Uncharacterized protein n=1 Tax=Tothia fuscella TaxID=1048955 RepID=A0A9P4NWN9_9PEZI|nr:hypothetical protein EJ08DRAFT_108492 [Tothia fuscella]
MPGNPPGYRYQPVHPLPDQDPLPRFPLAPPPGLLNVQPYLHPEIYQGHEPRINDPLARHQRIAELNARLAVLGEQQRQMQQRQIQQQEMHLADGRARNIVQMDNQLREMRERLNQRVQRQREVMDQMDNIRNGPNAAHVNLQQLQGIDPVRPNRLAPIPVPGMPGREQLLDQMAALEPALPEREQVDFLDWMQQMRAGTRPGAPPGFPPDNHVANQAAELDRQRRTAEMERRVRSAYHRTGRSARQDRERERQAQQVPQPRQRDQNLTHQNLRRHDLLPDDAAPGPEFVARRAPVAPQFPRAFPAPVPPQAPAPPPAPRPIPQNVMPAVGVQQILEPAVPRRNRDNRPVIIEISSDEEDG